MKTRTALTDEAALRRIEEIDPATAVVRGPSATADIRSAVAVRANAEQAVADAVKAARERGVTWVEIAGALGITHQGARQRYGKQ